MTPDDFVRQVRKSIVDENLSAYSGILAFTKVKDATDPRWKQALLMYDKLNIDEKEVLIGIIRQVMVDTISNVFAIIDGVCQLSGQQGDFILLANSPPETLSGELQDRFLELEEKSQ